MKTIISSRFTLVTVACIVIALYLVYFIVNQQYMYKVTSRFNVRFLNHNGDCFYMGCLLAMVASFLVMTFMVSFD